MVVVLQKTDMEMGQNRKSGLFSGVQTQWQRLSALRYSQKTKRVIERVYEGSKTEVTETREMAGTFFRMLSNKLKLNERKTPPTEKEVKAAIEQLKDVGRISVFASISILPGGGFSLIGLELLARKFGIRNFTFVPSSFRKKISSTGDLNIK